MDARIRRLACLAAAVAVVGGMTACSKSSSPAPRKTVVVTVTPTPTTHATSTAPSTPASSTSASTSAPPKHVTKLAGGCDDLLPLIIIEPALGHRITGKTAFVVGTPEKDIGRLGYINCRYGVAAGDKPPMLEIGVSLYDTPAHASARIPATTSDYVNHGATQSTATVDGQQASILTGGQGTGYTAPTLAVADGQRTVAITLNDPKTPAANVKTVLTKLAETTLKQTAPSA